MDAYTITQFCDKHNVSRPMYYKLRKAGLGPKIMHVGAKVLISKEAAAAWRKRMEENTHAEAC